MRADLGELSTFSRPGSFFLHGLTLSSVQKLSNCSEYQISSSSNAFQSTDRIFSALNRLIWAASPAQNIRASLFCKDRDPRWAGDSAAGEEKGIQTRAVVSSACQLSLPGLLGLGPT